MQSTLYVDSRMRTSGTHNAFRIETNSSLHLADHGMRVDNLRITNSFLTTDIGRYIYYKNGAGLHYYALPEQAYTGIQLAAALQTVTGKTTTYDPNTNAITQDATAGGEWLSDQDLKAFSAGFPAGAGGNDPKSINTVLGAHNFYITASPATYTIVWGFVSMAPYDYLFLRSRRLTLENSQDPSGRHDVLACLPLTKGIGSVETTNTADGVYMKLSRDLTLRTLDFELTDYLGNIVDMRGRPLSFAICFDE